MQTQSVQRDPYDYLLLFAAFSCGSVLLFLTLGSIALALPLLAAVVLSTNFALRCRAVADWADAKSWQLTHVSPRIFRCGPYLFVELAVTRVTLLSEECTRSGWLVQYRSRWDFWYYSGRQHDPVIHWDDEASALPSD